MRVLEQEAARASSSNLGGGFAPQRVIEENKLQEDKLEKVGFLEKQVNTYKLNVIEKEKRNKVDKS